MVYSPDNFEPLKQALEQASKVVTSPSVTKEQRTNSENVLIEFRKSKSPYEFCRYLLETSKDPYVIFQAVSTIQEATLREWSLLPPNLVIELQNFLLNYTINSVVNADSANSKINPSSSDKYVQRQILQTIAVFYKRCKLDSDSVKPNLNSSNPQQSKPAPSNIVKDIIELFKTSSSVKLKQICCSLMLALLNEFSNTGKSTKLGLSSDSHFTSKRSFEQSEFKLMLIFVFETTQDLIQSLIQSNIKSIKEIDKDSKEMLLQLFSLIDQSFSWEFTSSKHVLKNLIGNFNNQNNNSNTNTNTSLEPTPEFKEFFLNPDLITLLFKCYELVRDDPDMAHASMQPLIQLSTLDGPIFKDDDTDSTAAAHTHRRVLFLNNFLQAFLATFTKIQIREYESFNLACLMEDIMAPVNIKKIHLINQQLVEAFFNLVCEFVINCFKAEKACPDSIDSKKYLESYEKVLISWTSIKDYMENSECIFLKGYSHKIVESFLQSRLSLGQFEDDKENIQLADDGVDCESLDDDDDSTSDDLHRYKEILYSIREFAKYSLEYTLPMLSNLLNEKYLHLTEILNQMIQYNKITSVGFENKSNPAPLDLNLYNRHLTNLSEDIHWILMISGFILFEINSETDQCRIPTEILKYSISLSNFVDVNLINKLVMSLNQVASMPQTPLSSSSQTQIINKLSVELIETRLTPNDLCDPIIFLLFNSFQLCELESHMFSYNMLQFLSPQVASTLMWFLKEFVRSYLFMAEHAYTDLSPTLHTLFGQDTQAGTIVLSFLLRKLYTNFYIWSAENTTTSQTAKLLLEIVKHKDMSRILLNHEQFWSISKIAIVNEMPWLLLPSSVKKLIIKSLVVSCGTSLDNQAINQHDNAMQIHFATTILKPLSDRFDSLAMIKPEMIHMESCIKEVMSLIETLNGIIEGASKKIIKDLLPFVIPRLQQGVQLLDTYHNYGEIVELILCMFNGVIEKFLIHLSECPDAKNQIYHCFLCLIRIFCKHNSGKRSLEANIEEDYYNDLLLFMTLLNTLHNIDYDSEDNRFLTNQPSVNQQDQLTSIDIILMGLDFLIPLMNQEMLKFQALSIEYFKLISHIVYSNAEKLFSKSYELFSALINSIEFGINSGLGIEVVRHSLECIVPLCSRIFQTQTQHDNYAMCLRNLFKTVFDMIFKNSFEMDLFDVCSRVLHSFICCFQDTYASLVNQLVEKYEDDNVKQKILSGFNYLTPSNFTFNMEKRNRLKFNTKFNEFCVNTYGLLFIR